MLKKIGSTVKNAIWDRWRDSASGSQLDSPWDLLPLTPAYIENEHKKYVQAIEKALLDDEIRNIALTGSFGVGKSSILREVTKRHKDRVVELSLSTLAPFDAFPLDESVPKQAASPTNRIQQELVKQLLYREHPQKAPGSRFRRIERFSWLHASITAIVLGFVIALVFLLTGWTDNLVTTFSLFETIGTGVHAVVWIASTLILLAISRQVHGQLYIKQLAAGSATVTLDHKSVSYFDQYLDEIVYFFDISDQDIVIFEDIDRFEDSMIFETLRSLNTLLNASPQIDKSIRFIYAIKDSIFDQPVLDDERRRKVQGGHETEELVQQKAVELKLPKLGDQAHEEAVRANRTKFFDLVIPVVPFITHRSARDLATQILTDIDHSVDPALLDLAMKYAPDMRLLKNVRNEFIVFRDRVLSGEGSQLRLNDTDLFAMILYKSTHLADFEKIKLGTSNLDVLYQTSRTLVNENINRIYNEQVETRKRLDRESIMAKRSEQLGDQLLSLVNLAAQAPNSPIQNPTYTIEQSSFSSDESKTAGFWQNFISANANLTVSWSNRYDRRQLSFDKDQLRHQLSDSFDPEEWIEEDEETLLNEIDVQNEQLQFLRGADVGDLIQRTEFQTTYEGTVQSLDTIAQSLLSNGLAYRLLQAGRINRNFTLYTATFHDDRVSPAATNFIIHHANTGKMDENFTLTAKEVDEVVRECGIDSLEDSAFYNIAILDRLLQAKPEAAAIMLNSLSKLGDSETHFLLSYLSSGNETVSLVEQLTSRSCQTLIYLIRDSNLGADERLRLVNAALLSLTDDVDQETNDDVASYLLNNYTLLESLRSEEVDDSFANRLADLLARAGVLLPHIAPLSTKVRQSIIGKQLYPITTENLQIIADSEKNLALDQLRDVGQVVYDYMLVNIDDYLEAINGVSDSIAELQDFHSVIEDVLRSSPGQLSDVILQASYRCVLPRITEVSAEALPPLANHKRFMTTFENVSHYIDTVGDLDTNLAIPLGSVGAISEVEDVGDPDKVRLAMTILGADRVLESAEIRAKLVRSLELDDSLNLAGIAKENGRLFALLVRYNIIDDTAAAYEHLSGTTWETRELFIAESKHFQEYVTPLHIKDELSALLQSHKVGSSVKSRILDSASEFAEVTDEKGLVELARYAASNHHELPDSLVEKMALSGIPAVSIVPLLEPHLEEIELHRLISILNSLGNGYSQLTSVGKDQPKIPDTRANLTLLERLKRERLVRSWKSSDSVLRIFKRQK